MPAGVLNTSFVPALIDLSQLLNEQAASRVVERRNAVIGMLSRTDPAPGLALRESYACGQALNPDALVV